MSHPVPGNADRLYKMLPSIHRIKDLETGEHLRKYLTSIGQLLDRLEGTLEQRLEDHCPDLPGEGHRSQDWLLPYVAHLLSERMVSTDDTGRRIEVNRAIRWRKAKGTLEGLESISDELLRRETILQEGFARVAMTPRISSPGDPVIGKNETGKLRIRRPVGTVDFRKQAQAVECPPGNLGARKDHFVDDGGGRDITWYWQDAEGIPEFPGTYADPSRRTPDLREPNHRQGHYHPKRVLVFARHEKGFEPGPKSYPTLQAALAARAVIKEKRNDGGCAYRGDGEDPVWIDGDIDLTGQAGVQRFENVCCTKVIAFDGILELANGFALGIKTGELRARDSVILDLTAASAQLEYCTVGKVSVPSIRASDCILQEKGAGLGAVECWLRYSRVPEVGLGRQFRCTVDKPVFWGESGTELADRRILYPDCPVSIRFGAEDGGEMGAYHRDRHVLKEWALLEKLSDYLPVGQRAVIVPDPLEPPKQP